MTVSLRKLNTIDGVANLPIFVLFLTAALLHSQALDAYTRIVQEDEILEWITFWVFVAGAFTNGKMAWRGLTQSAQERFGLPWFAMGLAAFCLLVALEEISWGQRLFGYRPPAYFLAENFQQELNLHNTLGDDLRQLGFLGVCWGYGVFLPALSLWPAARGWLDRLGVVAPPNALVPSFAGTAVLYQAYPWSYTGEWAEAMLGSAILSAAVLNWGHEKQEPAALGGRRPGRRLLASWTAILVLGTMSAYFGRIGSSEDPARQAEARIELDRLRPDLGAARTRTRCGIHKRVYTMVEAYEHRHLYEGEFVSLMSDGLPEERAKFFLDPWNSPYWIQHICSKDGRRRAIFVYSFGPNRKRESTDWKIQGDDLGAWISRPRQSADD